MSDKAVDILTKLTKEILGAINFDPLLSKWEVENNDLPRTFFSDRLSAHPDSPFNKQAIDRMCKLYRSQFGIYKMKEPISEELSVRYANDVLNLLEELTQLDLHELKNIDADDSDNKNKRTYIFSCLRFVLLSLEDKEYFVNSDKLRNELLEVLDNYHKSIGTEGALTESQVRNFLVEAKGNCVRCGTRVIRSTEYDIAELYDFLFLDGVNNIQRDNTVLLCKNCYALLKDGVSTEEKNLLKAKKKQLAFDSRFREEIDDIQIEEEIEDIIRSLIGAKGDNLIPLDYEPKEVSEKIGDDFLLMEDVKGHVVKYFNYISQLLKDIGAEKNHKDIFIADEIKKLYLSISDQPGSKQDKYNIMVEWLKNKSASQSRKACEIVISYYIQDCEVFEKQ